MGPLDRRFPGAKELPYAQYLYLVRMVLLFGFEGGVHQCFLMLKRLGPESLPCCHQSICTWVQEAEIDHKIFQPSNLSGRPFCEGSDRLGEQIWLNAVRLLVGSYLASHRRVQKFA